MLQFWAANFLAAFSNVVSAETNIAFQSMNPNGADWPSLEENLRGALSSLEQHCRKLPVSRTMIRQIARVIERVQLGDNDGINLAMMTLVTELRMNLKHELDEHLFYIVPGSYAYLMTDGPLFGQQVDDNFPAASKDIAASSRCLALDEWTACVFHCMRVLEHGLRSLAEDVGASMAGALDFENWKNIIDQIEKKIREMESLAKGPEKSERTQFASEAASQFRYFKDAWRNHVSHSRSSYDSREAFAIWEHTRDFMGAIAKRLAEKEEA